MSGKSDEHTGGYERGWRDGFDEGFASADGFFVDVDDETLASHGLMRLPVDANGEQVDVGDDMRHPAGFCLKVVKLRMPEKGRGWFAKCTDGGTYPLGILVHAEPDSMECVADDMSEWACVHTDDVDVKDAGILGFIRQFMALAEEEK